MPICKDQYPLEEDYLYEEEVLRNPFSLKWWWRYLIAVPQTRRAIIYERALRALPGSYKLWHAYLREGLDAVRDLPVTHSRYETLNNTFERALVTMHKMPRIWILFLQSLTHQKLITRTRRAFDRALGALPVTQHGPVWERYVFFASQEFVPLMTSLAVYDRFLKYDPSYVEDYIEFLIDSGLWKEAAQRLAEALNDDFVSTKGKTRHVMWMELCELLVHHADEVSGLDVDAIIRGGIRKFRDEVGNLWTYLADYYLKRGLLEKARDVFEEGMAAVATVRDFSVVFDAYSQFEETLLSVKLEKNMDDDDDDEQAGFWFEDEDDVDMLLERYEHLIHRSSELVNNVQLRQNPHNVRAWHKRVRIFHGNPAKQILTYAEAVRTVDPIKAVGKPHTLWVAFAKLYETHGDVSNARAIFDRAVQADYSAVDHLANVWCEWAEMELRHKKFKTAHNLMKRATYEPSPEIKWRVTDKGDEPVQMKLYKSLKVWTFYVDLEGNLGTLESTRAVYDRIIDLRLATPQIIINYGVILQEHNYLEESFKVYERGVKIFKYPHVMHIWVTYISKFVAYLSKFDEKHRGIKMERARDIFERAIVDAPAELVKSLYLQYAKMEEDYGLAYRIMAVYDKATKAVPPNEKLGMYTAYIIKAAEMYGVPKIREIFERAINGSELADEDVRVMCLRYARLEESLGEIDRARALYKHASQFADPRFDHEVWNKWGGFEMVHGNEDTVVEMVRVKRSVSASYAALERIKLMRIN